MNAIAKVNAARKTLKNKALVKPEKFREFVLWMSTFEGLREPKTQEEFAKKFKVSQQTLSAWKKRDDFWDQVQDEWRRWGKEKTTNIMNKFYTTIMQQGESSNFKLWFQYFLNWAERQEREIKFAALEKISITTRKILEEKYDDISGDDENKSTGPGEVQK